MSITSEVIGVLGGMGPLATIDFMRKVWEATPAQRDQDHLPMLVSNIPQIPDRNAAFYGQGQSPLLDMVASAKRLKAAGATVLVMPCNTAHLWFESVHAAVQLPMLHIVDAALLEASGKTGDTAVLGLLATDATMSSGLYQKRSAREATGLNWLEPTPTEMLEWVMPGIREVKAGHLAEGAVHLAKAAQALQRRGAVAVVMGCTEIPVVLTDASAGVPVVDATAALARATVRWAMAQSQSHSRR